ncbi:MAG TPA: hypothetical protein ENI02_02085 [Candidatus Aminicenantes bacterium]|nr:hypothetical protein [Candidatus Aminicenantes bacterium]
MPQRVKSNSDQGFALLSSGEEPCPLSLSHGFSPYSHRQARAPDRVGRRVCLSEASYAAAEKSDEGMALKI